MVRAGDQTYGRAARVLNTCDWIESNAVPAGNIIRGACNRQAAVVKLWQLITIFNQHTRKHTAKARTTMLRLIVAAANAKKSIDTNPPSRVRGKREGSVREKRPNWSH